MPNSDLDRELHEGKVIQSGDFAITESPLRISVDATLRLLRTAEQSGISTEFPALVSSFFQRAAEQGLGGEEAAALIKVMRPASNLALKSAEAWRARQDSNLRPVD